MMKLKNLLAGLAGAVALNILHETLKHTHVESPRVDLIGEEALQKTAYHLGQPFQSESALYQATLAGDLVSNTIYYSMIGSGKGQHIWTKAIAMGLMAGLGAISLPKPMGLDPEPVTKSNQVKLLTVGYYVFGALVTGLFLSTRKRA